MIPRFSIKLASNSILIIFIVSLFLLLGTDNPTLVQPHLWFGFFTYFLFWAVNSKGFFSKNAGRFSFIFLSAVVLFTLVRAMWAFLLVNSMHVKSSLFLPLNHYMEAPLKWCFVLATFFTGYRAFKQKSFVCLSLNAMSWAGFFLAVNALPALLLTGNTSYVDSSHNQKVFFFPFFYSFEWVPRYVMNRFAHPNYIGDIMSFGLFAALGLAVYGVHILRLRSKGGDVGEEQFFLRAPISFILLRIMIAILIAVVTFLPMSRGTISCFILTLIIFSAAIGLKFLERLPVGWILIGLIAAFSVLAWSVNFKKVQVELHSLGLEVNRDSGVGRSIDTNIEGRKRALAIHKAYSVFGVGTEGFTDISPSFTFTLERLSLADAVVMNHYLQTLAEEGVGAFFYFAFLGIYLLEVLKGLFVTRSRFKFVMGLSFFAPVVMVFLHASFNHLMEGFGTQTMVFLNMGASLSVLRSDFERS